MKTITLQPRLWMAAAIILLPIFVAGKAYAASTGSVNTTVTPQNISVTVSDGSVAYGTLSLNSSANTSSSGVNDTQIATNDGNITEDFNIRSSDATGGTTWTLAGAAGANQFSHSFCKSGSGTPDPCDATPTWSAMSTSYSSLATAVAASGTQRFDLRLNTPTSSTDFVQKSIAVTIQAVQN